METEPRRIETLSRLEPYPGTAPEAPWHQSGRARLFGAVFGLTLLLGLIWTFLQPVIYRSSATVLMSAPQAIDAMVSEADVQNVAIQREILLGGEITRRLLQEMERSHGSNLDSAYLRDVLRVEPVPETNLVEMAAQGDDGDLFPALVNAWIDVYLGVRAEDIEQNKQRTMQVVQDELDGLAIKLEEAREALEQYRLANEIISVERQENEVLARLDGLNKALNNAVEEEVKARAHLETMREAIRRGEKVVPQGERRNVEAMESELRQLQATMLELTQRYTMEYINKEPRYRSIPDRIAELERELSSRLSQGRQVELANAAQAHAAAQRTVLDLEGKLEAHKQEVSDFNRVYATHEALAEDLARLEELNREAQARLVQVEVRRVEKYPQVSVINRPEADSIRIGPSYMLLVGGTLLASLVLGVLSVWLYGFLGHKKEQPAYVTLSGVHMYPQEAGGELAYNQQADPRLAQSEAARLLKEKGTGEPEEGPDDAPPDPELK